MCEIKATFRLLGTEEGGRQTAITSGYRPAFYLGESQTDGVIEVLGRAQQAPGETLSVRIKFLHPENFGLALAIGAEFEAREGSKIIGRGKVTELLQTDLR